MGHTICTCDHAPAVVRYISCTVSWCLHLMSMSHNELTLLRSACRAVEGAIVMSNNNVDLRGYANLRKESKSREPRRIPLLHAAVTLAQQADLMIGLKTLPAPNSTLVLNTPITKIDFHHGLPSLSTRKASKQRNSQNHCKSKHRPSLPPSSTVVASSTTEGHNNNIVLGSKRNREVEHIVNNEISLAKVPRHDELSRPQSTTLTSSLMTKSNSRSM